jgi:hypothetical protein
MNIETPFSYYADLNPRYGSRYQGRWAVFLRRSATEAKQTTLHYTTRKAAERAAAKIMSQEADPQEAV